jgi:putative ABC transport system ATP-binding protein
MSDSLFSLRSINKRFSANDQVVEIFENMDFELPKGEFLAVMGPSGSGKTTLLNLLGAIDRPDRGSIWYGNECIDQFSQDKLSVWRRQHVAFIFQSYNLLPMLSATRNVELPLLLTNMRAAERRKRANAALELVELAQHASRLPAQLSGGQQQRVAIARALVADPAVLLCDEPTGNLDRRTSDEIMQILALLNTEFNKTIVLVTHDREAARYAKRICRLDKGQFSFEPVEPGMATLVEG